MIEKFLPIKLSRYLIKNLLKMFFLILLISFMIVFMITFFEFSSKIQKYSINHLIAIKIITYRTMPVIEVIMIFILALTINFELIRISENNELTIVYMSNYSPWKVLNSIFITTIIIGFLDITLFNRLSIKLYNISEKLFLEAMGKDSEKTYLESKNGIWLSLRLMSGEDLIIKSGKVFIDKLSFHNIDGLLIDQDGILLKKISAKKMLLSNDEIIFNDLVSIEKSELNYYKDKVIMTTDVDNKFIKKQLLNKYEKLKLIPFLSLRKLIYEYKTAGLDTKKFEAKRFNFISMPFYFIFIACFVFLNVKANHRNSKNTLITLKVIIMTIILFIMQSVISELSANGTIYLYSNLVFVIFILLIIFDKLLKEIELI